MPEEVQERMLRLEGELERLRRLLASAEQRLTGGLEHLRRHDDDGLGGAYAAYA